MSEQRREQPKATQTSSFRNVQGPQNNFSNPFPNHMKERSIANLNVQETGFQTGVNKQRPQVSNPAKALSKNKMLQQLSAYPKQQNMSLAGLGLNQETAQKFEAAKFSRTFTLGHDSQNLQNGIPQAFQETDFETRQEMEMKNWRRNNQRDEVKSEASSLQIQQENQIQRNMLPQVKNYRQTSDFSEKDIEKIVKQTDRQFQAIAKKEARHDPQYWKENPQRLALLQNVLLEPLDDDSEDEAGQPRYIESKDTFRKQLQSQLRNLKDTLKNQNLKDREIESHEEVMRLEYEIQMREQVWLEQQKLKRRNIEKMRQKSLGLESENSSENSGSSSGNSNQKGTVGINQLNIAVNNIALSSDIQIEMGILAQRERRRFNQCRRLGLKIPASYIRINRITAMPRFIQEEIVKYPSAIEDDSDYEDDDSVLQNYDGRYVDYIMKRSQANREELEAGGEPRRIYAARRKAGDFHTDIYSQIYNEAISQFLSDNGVKKGLTREKMDGSYKRPEKLNDEGYMRSEINRYFVEALKKCFDEYGSQIFEKDPTIKQKVLDKLGGQQTILKAHPEIISAMYQDAKDLTEVPESLRIEDLFQQKSREVEEQKDVSNDQNALHSSPLIRKTPLVSMYKEHLNKRKSGASSQPSIKQDSDDQQEYVDLQQNFDFNQGSFGNLDQEVMNQSNPFSANNVKNGFSNNIDKKWKSLSPIQHVQSYNQANEDNMKQEADLLSNSESSGQARAYQENRLKMIREDSLRENQEQLQMIANKLKNEQERLQFSRWNSDFIMDILKDQGFDKIHEMRDYQISRRKLSRREQSDQNMWSELSSSAEQSDESIKKAQFQHPLLTAKQRVANQKIIPERRKKAMRRPQDLVFIEGKQYKWDDFKREVITQANDHNNQKDQSALVTEREFLLYEGDRNHEKVLTWTAKGGFVSENSDDERTTFNREMRFFKREMIENHLKNQPILLSRPIQPFERLLLKLGGAQLLKKHTGKKFEVDSPDSQFIYAWYDPNFCEGDPFKQRFGNFLLAESKDDYFNLYEKEREMQLKVMDKDEKRVRFSIFANELVSLYEVVSRILKSWVCNNRDEENLKNDIKSLLPKSRREYEDSINFEGFWAAEQERLEKKKLQQEEEQKQLQQLKDKNSKPAREKSAFESDSFESRQGFSIPPYDKIDQQDNLPNLEQISQQEEQKSLGGFQNDDDGGQGFNEYPEDNGAGDFGFDQDYQNNVQDLDQEEEKIEKNNQNDNLLQQVEHDHQDQFGSFPPSPLESKVKSRDAQIAAGKITPRKIESTPIQIEPPKFYIPDSRGPDFEALKRRLLEFDKVKFVDDSEEVTSIINESLLIKPEHIEKYLVPELEKVIESSNGRLRGFFIWPQYKRNGYDMIYPLGRRYPKRLKLYSPQPEDIPIIIKGIEVGFLVSAVPYLFPDSWAGQAIPLQDQRNLPKMSPIKRQNAPEERKQRVRAEVGNQVNRGRGPSNQRGQPNKKRKAGEAEIDNDEYPGAVEYQMLPFLKQEANQKEIFEKISSKEMKLPNGKTEHRILLEIKPYQRIQEHTPTSIRLKLINVDKIDKVFRFTHQEKKGVPKNAMINDKFILGAGNIWSIKNDDGIPHQLMISFEA